MEFKMQCLLLVTKKMEPVPEGIKTVQDWGETSIYVSDGDFFVSGNHMWLQGDESDFVDWLRPLGKVWITKPGTSPMIQQFVLVGIKEV
jgi:hypothetical protein